MSQLLVLDMKRLLFKFSSQFPNFIPLRNQLKLEMDPCYLCEQQCCNSRHNGRNLIYPSFGRSRKGRVLQTAVLNY